MSNFFTLIWLAVDGIQAGAAASLRSNRDGRCQPEAFRCVHSAGGVSPRRWPVKDDPFPKPCEFLVKDLVFPAYSTIGLQSLQALQLLALSVLYLGLRLQGARSRDRRIHGEVALRGKRRERRGPDEPHLLGFQPNTSA